MSAKIHVVFPLLPSQANNVTNLLNNQQTDSPILIFRCSDKFEKGLFISKIPPT